MTAILLKCMWLVVESTAYKGGIHGTDVSIIFKIDEFIIFRLFQVYNYKPPFLSWYQKNENLRKKTTRGFAKTQERGNNYASEIVINKLPTCRNRKKILATPTMLETRNKTAPQLFPDKPSSACKDDT